MISETLEMQKTEEKVATESKDDDAICRNMTNALLEANEGIDA